MWRFSTDTTEFSLQAVEKCLMGSYGKYDIDFWRTYLDGEREVAGSKNRFWQQQLLQIYEVRKELLSIQMNLLDSLWWGNGGNVPTSLPKKTVSCFLCVNTLALSMGRTFEYKKCLHEFSFKALINLTSIIVFICTMWTNGLAIFKGMSHKIRSA